VESKEGKREKRGGVRKRKKKGEVEVKRGKERGKRG
jgi:hypothetical protein